MSSNSSYVSIPKSEFQAFLEKHFYFRLLPERYYDFDWEETEGGWIKRERRIKEYLVDIPLTPEVSIKGYSSILREGRGAGEARGPGDDAIRLVPVEKRTLKPILKRRKRINRVGDWQTRFLERVRDILHALGNSMICPICKSPQIIRKNLQAKINFLGCSRYPVCKATSSILAHSS